MDKHRPTTDLPDQTPNQLEMTTRVKFQSCGPISALFITLDTHERHISSWFHTMGRECFWGGFLPESILTHSTLVSEMFVDLSTNLN